MPNSEIDSVFGTSDLRNHLVAPGTDHSGDLFLEGTLDVFFTLPEFGTQNGEPIVLALGKFEISSQMPDALASEITTKVRRRN